MIQITLSFNTLDEAIVFLGKQHAVKKVRTAATDAGAPATTGEATPPTPSAAPDAPATTKKQRKPRADAGKKRGSYKNVEAPEKTDAVPPPTPPEAPAASTPETAPPEASAQQATTAAQPLTPEAGAAPKEDELIAAGDALLNAKGLPAVMELMQSFGVNRLRDLPEDKRAEFIEKATA